MIDLAPNHKLGLMVANPILLGAEAIGYGETVPRGLAIKELGAAVVGPLLGGSRGGQQPPRLAHANGGAVLQTGLQNRGVNNAIQQFGKLWDRLGCSVLVQVAESHPLTLSRLLAKLGGLPAVQGIELLPPPGADAGQVRDLLRTAERACELPLWVKLPLTQAAVLAPVAVETGAVGLVVGQPPTGAGLRTGVDGQGRATDYTVSGLLYGPLVFSQMLATVLQVAALRLPVALIACGGIHTPDHVRQALAAGAQAVQIDSAVWVEPGLAGSLARACAGSPAAL